jgi:6-phosphogluconolactonase
MKEYYIYLGTYTNKDSKGIYGMRISQEGKLIEELKLLAEQPSPTYFYLSRNRRFLYAASEPGEGEKGAIYVYKIDPETKNLELIDKRTAAGRGLCHITMDKQERYAVVTCYPDATVQVYPVDHHGKVTEMFCLRRHSGCGPVDDRQESAHAHSAYFTPDGLYMVVCDLGIDELVLYTMNEETGKLHRTFGKNVTMPAGCGPRHMVFSPDGHFAYVVCELSSELVTLRYKGEEGFEIIDQISCLSPEFHSERSFASAIRISKDGRDLYVSNRGEDSIAHFKVDVCSGHAQLVKSYSTRGWYPRDFILTEDENLLIAVNQLSENMAIYKRDPKTGALELTDEQTIVNAPVALQEV